MCFSMFPFRSGSHNPPVQGRDGHPGQPSPPVLALPSAQDPTGEQTGLEMARVTVVYTIWLDQCCSEENKQARAYLAWRSRVREDDDKYYPMSNEDECTYKYKYIRSLLGGWQYEVEVTGECLPTKEKTGA